MIKLILLKSRLCNKYPYLQAHTKKMINKKNWKNNYIDSAYEELGPSNNNITVNLKLYNEN